jgi:hypothetical protein
MPLPDPGEELEVPLVVTVQSDDMPDEVEEYEQTLQLRARRVHHS